MRTQIIDGNCFSKTFFNLKFFIFVVVVKVIYSKLQKTLKTKDRNIKAKPKTIIITPQATQLRIFSCISF